MRSLYSYNSVQALNEQALYYRSSSNLNIGGVYFSTFFGGGDDSWAPPADVNAYFRNFQLFGSSAASNLTGAKVSAAPPRLATAARPGALAWAAFACLIASTVPYMIRCALWDSRSIRAC